MTVNAAQQQQSLLTVTAPKAKAAAPSRSAESGESTFRSTMERAEQNAAAAAKPGDAEQPQEAEQEVQPEGELNAEATQEETTTPAKPGAEEAGSAMEGVTPGWMEIIVPKPEEQEGQAEEELALSMSQAAALQQAAPVQAPEAQQDIAQQAAGGAVEAVMSQKDQGQGTEQAKAMEQPVLEQAAASREGEAQAQPTNSQITAPGAAQEQAGMESAARQAAEGSNQNTAEAPKQEAAGAEQAAQTIFAAQQPGPDAVVDLSAANAAEPLPEAEAGRTIQQSLLEQVQTAVTTGKDELFIQLKPESLGGLVIHLSMTEEGIKAQVRTASENIQGLVNAQIVQLEDALRARDIPVVQMEVIYDPSAGNGFLNDRGRSWQEGGAQQGRGGYGVASVEDLGSVYEAAALAAVSPEDGLEGPGVEYSA